MELKDRLDIYLNGEYGLKDWVIGMLLAPRHLPEGLKDVGRALSSLWIALAAITIMLCAPLLFWLAPGLAVFTARRTLTDEEVREHLRRGIHQNGSGS